ncbi:MAG: ATP-binding protein [Planctomycetota bacterium]
MTGPSRARRSTLRRDRPPPEHRAPGPLLGRLSIRPKLAILHTALWLLLAGVLLLALRPSVRAVVREADRAQAGLAASILAQDPSTEPMVSIGAQDAQKELVVSFGTSGSLGVPEELERALEPGRMVEVPGRAAVWTPLLDDPSMLVEVEVLDSAAGESVVTLYWLVVAALLAVYALVVVALELFVLPQHVYAPIRRMRDADRALQMGYRDGELIPEALIPGDELGAIMRSRNQSVRALRDQEEELGVALARVEDVALDLRRKNHLLESTRRHLADADRLASLGMMSAGLAHELNTPLAVIRGTIERVQRSGTELSATDAALLLRVTGRLERLSESLLDFARARAPKRAMRQLRPIVDEAMTLVGIDRKSASVEYRSSVPDELSCACDADRLVQVFVNLLRNSADALAESGSEERVVEVTGHELTRDGVCWVSVEIADTGPGLPPETIPTLFVPFVTSRLDAKGTGLGLAVAEGIAEEHGGVILAGNRRDRRGARFEVLLPKDAPAYPAGEEEAE